MHCQQKQLLLLAKTQQAHPKQRCSRQIEGTKRFLLDRVKGTVLPLVSGQRGIVIHRELHRRGSSDELHATGLVCNEGGPQDLVSRDDGMDAAFQQLRIHGGIEDPERTEHVQKRSRAEPLLETP